MVSQCVLLTSCSSSMKASELVKQILFVEELPPSTSLLENVCEYPWHIDTKYYSADVLLCTTETHSIGDESFAKTIQAFVVIFDSTQPTSFDEVQLWLPFLKQLQPDVQLLVCDHCTDDDPISRNHALDWCIENSFELIELNSPTVDNDDSDEDDFQETVGIQRIIEALSCHSWPDLIIKDNPTFRSAYIQQLMSTAASDPPAPSDKTEELSNCTDRATCDEVDATDEHVSDYNSTETSEAVVKPAPEADTSLNSRAVSDAVITSMESTLTADRCTDEESFEQLFERLQLMKEAAAGMSLDDRKKYAEQVTMQFWQAVGGNMDEFEGLSDLSDSD